MVKFNNVAKFTDLNPFTWYCVNVSTIVQHPIHPTWNSSSDTTKSIAYSTNESGSNVFYSIY